MILWRIRLFSIAWICSIMASAQPVSSYVVKGDTSLNPVPVCKEYVVDFQEISSGIIDSVFWYFPSATPDSAYTSNVSVSWSANGTYACALTVVDTSGASDTVYFNVVVSSIKPTVNFGFIPDYCKSDPPVLLTQGIPSGGDYFGIGVSNNRFNPAIADTGYHTLGYVYTAPNGCSDTAFSIVYVKPGPNASLLELNDFGNCDGFSFSNPNFSIELYGQSSVPQPDSIVNHEVLWGDGTLGWDSTDFRQGLKHTYFGQGIFRLTYVVTSSNGCTDTAKYTIINTTNPASLNITNPGGTNGCAPITVTFPLSTANVDTTVIYSITWGDGKDTTFKHPPPSFITHSYDTTSCIKPGGFFTVTATATNACVSTQSTIQGPFVTQPAIAEFSPSPGCVGVQHALPNFSIPGYTNACSRLTTYIWDFGDGSPPLTQIVNTPIPPPGTHTWNAVGTYNVTLISVAPAGLCQGDTITYPVCIEEAIQPTVSITDTIGCQPVVPTLVNNSDTSSLCTSPIYGWYVDSPNGWSLTGGSTMNDWVPNIQFTEAGTYTLSYYLLNNCGGDTISQNIYVRDKPEVTLPQNIQPYCDTVIVNTLTNPKHQQSVIDNGSAVTSYLWRISPSVPFLNNTDSTSQYPVFKLEPNTYTIQLIVTNGCGSDTATQTVLVNSLTNGGFLTNVTSGCTPLSVIAQSTSSLGVQHTWYINGTQYSTSRDTSMVLTNSGTVDLTYQILLSVYSGPGCQDSIMQIVTVHPQPTANFTGMDVCLGGGTQFSDSSSAAVAPINQWFWDFGDGATSSLQSPIHNYTNAGHYFVGLTVTDTNGCTDFFGDSVWVRSIPTAAYGLNYSSFPDSACIQDSIYFIDASTVDANGSPIVSWAWDIFNDGIIDATTQNTSYVFPTAGTFPVKLVITSAQGCTDTIIDSIYISNPPLPFFTLSNTVACTPFTTTVTNQSSGYVTDYNWLFYSLDSNSNQVVEHTSTQANPNPLPVFQANALTNKVIYVELTASNDCYSATYFDTINIKPIPIPFFIFSSDTGCSPLTVAIQVDGLATGNPDSIVFDFGDGTPGLTLFPNINILPNGDTLFTWNQQMHTFVYNGQKLDTTYYVTLRASSECGDSTYTSPINVKNRSVQSFFIANKNTGCSPLSVTFSDVSFASQAVSYCFNFDTINKVCNGPTFSGPNPSYTFNQAGLYVVAQFAFNNCGADTSYQVIDVRPGPNVQFTFTNPTCKGDSIYFTNNTTLSSGNIWGYKWTFGDGDSSFITSPAHYYATAGTYTVCLTTFTDAGCDSTYCQQIVISGTPVADFSFTNNVCRNLQPIQFTNLSTNGGGNIISYEWFFGDGGISTQINPSYTYASPGTYDVKLLITNDNGCVDSIIQPLTIYPVPTADFSYVIAGGDTCGAPQTVQFTNNSNGAGGYYWDFNSTVNPGQDTSIQMHPSFTFTQPGYYDVMLISRNGLGCEDTIIKRINIHPIPVPDFIPDMLSGCAPMLVVFNNTTRLPVGFTDSIAYTWHFGDGTSSTQTNPIHTYKNPGSYTVTLVAESEYGCIDSVTYSGLISIFPVPAPNFNFTLQEFGIFEYRNLTTGGTLPYQSYYWDFDDGQFSTDRNPTHEFDIDRVGWERGFRVCLTVVDANGCDSTWCDTVTVGAFTLFVPNAMAPDSQGEESIFLPKGQGLETYSCMIFDRWGNLLWQTDKLDPSTASPTEGWDGTYQGQPVPPGVYVWRIDATFANDVIWRGSGFDQDLGTNTGTITVLR